MLTKLKYLIYENESNSSYYINITNYASCYIRFVLNTFLLIYWYLGKCELYLQDALAKPFILALFFSKSHYYCRNAFYWYGMWYYLIWFASSVLKIKYNLPAHLNQNDPDNQ